MWTCGTIDDLCNIEYGTRVVKKNEKGTEYPVYGGGGESFRIDRFNRVDRLVISRFGMSLKCTRYISGKFFLNDSGLTLSPKNKNLSQQYLDKLILSLNNNIFYLGSGSAQKNLRMDKFRLLKIFYPSLPEQKSIVKKLDDAFFEINQLNNSNKEALQQKLTLEENFYKDFFKSLEDQYGTMKLEEGIKLISGQHIMSKDYNSNRDGIGYLTGPADFRSVSPVVSKFTLKPKKTALKNDILITLKGSGIGKVNIMDQNELAISRQLAAIRAIKFVPSYLLIFLKTKFDYFQKLGNGAAIPGLSRVDVQKLEVPKVPIAKQHKVLEKLQKFQILISRYETLHNLKFKELNSLKLSILSKELKGEVI